MAATAPKWTGDDLRAVVAAGMSVADARALLEDGLSVELAVELATLQASAKKQEAADAQTATAKAMQKAMRPENEFHPGKSVFSYPEGDTARPKALPFEFFYNGYPCHKFLETEHWRDVELMARVQPGTFTVLRKDGTQMAVEVLAERDANQVITKLDVRFPISREEKWLVPPVLVVLYQLVHPDHPKRRFLEAMQEYLALTLGDTAAAV